MSKRKVIKLEKRVNRSVDVLFVMPPTLRFNRRTSWSYPLGFGYMVSMLEKNGISAYIYNSDFQRDDDDPVHESPFMALIKKAGQILGLKGVFSDGDDFAEEWPNFYRQVKKTDHPIWEEVRTVLKSLRPRIIGISSKVVDIPSTMMLATIAKGVLPESKVIIGGISAITNTDVLMNNKDVDFLVLNEGEETIVELAKHMLGDKAPSELGRIRGIVYRVGSQVKTTEQRPLVADLDQLPFPDRESLFHVEADGSYTFYVRADDILTSRGCPFPCRFCAAHIAWGSKCPRFRSIDNVLEEIKQLHDRYQQDTFILWDDLFTVKRDRVLEFCSKIKAAKLDVRWLCMMRITDIDPELMQIMREAGCYEVQIGIESGCDRILKLVRKEFSVDTIRQKVSFLQSSGIQWRAFFIIGFPSETEEEIRMTLDFIREIRPTYPQINIFCPYPGTGFFNDLKEGAMHADSFTDIDIFNPNNNFTGTMSNRAFRKLALQSFKMVASMNK